MHALCETNRFGTDQATSRLSPQVCAKLRCGRERLADMKRINQRIALRQEEFASHSFFARFAADAQAANVLDAAAGLTFWVFTFQNFLRLIVVGMNCVFDHGSAEPVE
jgi:hypothetical protein